MIWFLFIDFLQASWMKPFASNAPGCVVLLKVETNHFYSRGCLICVEMFKWCNVHCLHGNHTRVYIGWILSTTQLRGICVQNKLVKWKTCVLFATILTFHTSHMQCTPLCQTQWIIPYAMSIIMNDGKLCIMCGRTLPERTACLANAVRMRAYMYSLNFRERHDHLRRQHADASQKVSAYAHAECHKSFVILHTIISIRALQSPVHEFTEEEKNIRKRLTQPFSSRECRCVRSKALVYFQWMQRHTHHSLARRRRWHLARAIRKMENGVKWRRGRLGKIALGDVRTARIIQLSLGYRHD